MDSDPRRNAESENTATETALNKCTLLKCRSQKNQQAPEQTIYIVGTAHVSRSSCDLVQKVIQDVQPDGIFLELCDGRRGLLKASRIGNKEKDLSLQDYLAFWRSGKGTLFEVLYCWMLERFGSELEVSPGEEFRVAYEEARKIDAIVMLGDRPVNITVKRMWSSLSLWQKMQLCFMLLVTGIYIPDKDEMMKLFNEWEDTDALTEAIRELSKSFPSLAINLIEERDLYMVHTLHQLAHSSTKIVAVVGAGHLPGIRANWDKEIDMESLTSLTPQKRPSSMWRYLLIVSSGMLLISVGYLKLRAPRL